MTHNQKKKTLGLPGMAILLALTVIITVIVTLAAARIWLFQPDVSPVVLDTREEARLEDKLKILEEASRPGEYSESPEDRVLYLTQRELNAIVARDPALAGRLFFHLSDAKISATLLVDIPEDMPVFAGRRVEVATGLEVEYAHGRLSLIVEGISLMGVPLPSAWLGGLKGRDLLELEGPGGDLARLLGQGVQDLQVKDGRLRIELAE